jgi:hypothetical protein
MSFAKFVYLLQYKELYFARLDHLEDEMEGIIDVFPLRDKNRESYLRINKYVNCWHINEHESEAMWKLYGGVHLESIAVRSSVDRIKRAIANDHSPVMIGKIDYDKEPKELEEQVLHNFYAQVVYKRKIFAHEKELRLCVSGENANPPEYLITPLQYIKDTHKLSRLIVDEKLYPKKVLVKVDLSSLIDEVVVGDCWLKPLTEKLIKAERLNCAGISSIRKV